jgi:hypothetical protein
MLETLRRHSSGLSKMLNSHLILGLLWSALRGSADGVDDGLCPSWQGS